MYWYFFEFYTVHSMSLICVGNLILYLFSEWLFCYRVFIIYVFLFIYLYIVYLCFQKYVCVLYSIFSLFVINPGNLVIFIYLLWVIIPLFHHNIVTVNILVDEHSLVWIYNLFFAWIKTWMFVTNFSISHIFASYLKFLLLLNLRASRWI